MSIVYVPYSVPRETLSQPKRPPPRSHVPISSLKLPLEYSPIQAGRRERIVVCIEAVHAPAATVAGQVWDHG